MTDKIMELLTRQFADIMSADEDCYKDYHIYLSNEQQYVRESNREKGAIYVVVKFLPASLNFGQTVLPVTINAVAERNKIEVAQRLLLEFAQAYNLTTNEDGDVKQTYTSPAVSSNFNEIFDGFRTLFYMSGTFLISENANPYKLYFHYLVDGVDTKEEIDCISCGCSFDIQLDTQAFASSDNFTQSVGMVGTVTVNLTSYLTDNAFFHQVLGVAVKDLTNYPDGVNTEFECDLEFKNGQKITSAVFKLANASIQQNIGELPVVSVTLTN